MEDDKISCYAVYIRDNKLAEKFDEVANRNGRTRRRELEFIIRQWVTVNNICDGSNAIERALEKQ